MLFPGRLGPLPLRWMGAEPTANRKHLKKKIAGDFCLRAKSRMWTCVQSEMVTICF